MSQNQILNFVYDHFFVFNCELIDDKQKTLSSGYRSAADSWYAYLKTSQSGCSTESAPTCLYVGVKLHGQMSAHVCGWKYATRPALYFNRIVSDSRKLYAISSSPYRQFESEMSTLWLIFTFLFFRTHEHPIRFVLLFERLPLVSTTLATSISNIRVASLVLTLYHKDFDCCIWTYPEFLSKRMRKSIASQKVTLTDFAIMPTVMPRVVCLISVRWMASSWHSQTMNPKENPSVGGSRQTNGYLFKDKKKYKYRKQQNVTESNRNALCSRHSFSFDATFMVPHLRTLGWSFLYSGLVFAYWSMSSAPLLKFACILKSKDVVDCRFSIVPVNNITDTFVSTSEAYSLNWNSGRWKLLEPHV